MASTPTGDAGTVDAAATIPAQRTEAGVPHGAVASPQPGPGVLPDRAIPEQRPAPARTVAPAPGTPTPDDTALPVPAGTTEPGPALPVTRARAFRTAVLPVFLGAAAVATATIAATGLLLTPSSSSPLPTPATVTGSGAPLPRMAPLSPAAAAALVDAVPGTALSAADPVVALTAWRDNGGLGHLVAIGDGFDRLATAAGRQDAVELAVACGTLQTVMRDARGYDAVPDAVAQGHWTALLDHGSAAATACMSGALTFDARQLTAFTEQSALVRQDLTATATRIHTALT
ncbi:hypothetical protein AD006_09780 [Pseudonocardia sp. EC080610-09]|uniref:hypothetical protein n=1 Tax=unclassified Pseudonocardia TaxID=2619320 RepID=UPI0006CB7124|nr:MULTISPECIES: hypothetical protein [unclassified Pseudonocardia]ALE72244.1 hypothetical protein FRP1_02160 [Pseudonocardia sp. EC080625-04]ALL75527.1 hypothetical protein AD006_09780 [Pseudonocardia sp. EC080610-09]ALL82554.1 hypothetical protein AD017_17610 [Pseudonocardia sp. EC080619-01]